MTSVKTLIDKWSVTRKEKALASALGVTPQRLSAMKHGHIPMPPDVFLHLVELLEEPDQVQLVYDFVKQKADKMSATFSWLLRRGMAATSMGCALA